MDQIREKEGVVIPSHFILLTKNEMNQRREKRGSGYSYA